MSLIGATAPTALLFPLDRFVSAVSNSMKKRDVKDNAYFHELKKLIQTPPHREEEEEEAAELLGGNEIELVGG